MTIGERIAPLRKEPLVHFLIAGALVFGVFGGPSNAPADRAITITESQVAQLGAGWTQTWKRPPSPAELDGLIRDYVKEEVYYREAIRLGLDTDDPVVRRRLRSKMEFLANAEAEEVKPEEAALQAWLNAHRDKYGAATKLSFDQIYVSGNAARANAALVRLRAGDDPASVGDALPVPARLDATKTDEIDRQFGEGFAAILMKQPLNSWSGPIASGFGNHLVRMRVVDTGAPPQLNDVRQAVENDWRVDTKERTEARAYQALLDLYTVRIAKPK